MRGNFEFVSFCQLVWMISKTTVLEDKVRRLVFISCPLIVANLVQLLLTSAAGYTY